MRVTRTIRQMFLLLAILLTGSLLATGCSLIPEIGGFGADSGTEDKGNENKKPGEPGQDQADLKADDAAPDLGKLPDNAQACVSVAGVVIAGSTLAFIAKLDPDGEGTQKMAHQVQDTMKNVPKEVKGDLERLLSVINESAVNGKSFDDEKFKQAMEPVSQWVKKNCGAGQ